MHKIKTHLPGLGLLLAIALVSTFIAGFLPAYIGTVFIAVVIGVIIANVFRPDKEVFGKGVKLGLGKFLKIAIVLLGAGISFQEILKIGGGGLIVIVTLILFVFGVTFAIGKIMGVSLRKILLIAVGVSICGNTAVVTTAPLVEAEEDEVAMAVAIVTLFGVLSVLLYPMIGLAMGMEDLFFGLWAGTAINDTSQVVAAGFIFSDEAGKIATTIKLTRNVMIVPVVLAVAYFYRKTLLSSDKSAGTAKKVNVVEIFPTFIVGFLAFAIINSLGLLSEEVSARLVEASKFLILLALSGIGLGVDFKKFKAIGLKPFVLGFSVELLLAIGAIVLINIVFAGSL